MHQSQIHILRRDKNVESAADFRGYICLLFIYPFKVPFLWMEWNARNVGRNVPTFNCLLAYQPMAISSLPEWCLCKGWHFPWRRWCSCLSLPRWSSQKTTLSMCSLSRNLVHSEIAACQCQQVESISEPIDFACAAQISLKNSKVIKTI